MVITTLMPMPKMEVKVEKEGGDNDNNNEKEGGRRGLQRVLRRSKGGMC